MNLCTIFNSRDNLDICGREATRYIPLALGHARMKTLTDALLTGYVPVCPHHAEMIPLGIHLLYTGDDGRMVVSDG